MQLLSMNEESEFKKVGYDIVGQFYCSYTIGSSNVIHCIRTLYIVAYALYAIYIVTLHINCEDLRDKT